MSKFIAYVGDRAIHDSVVLDVAREGAVLTVTLDTDDERTLKMTFTGVRDVVESNPAGMLVYAVSEFGPVDVGRRFVFAPSDERVASRLEVVADDVTWELGPAG